MKYSKLAVAGIQLLVTVAMIATATFAWFTASVSPEVNGVQMSIGGNSTIAIAPDITKTVDGVVHHYPGSFTESMEISQWDTYDYIQEIDALFPVSTADGVHWMLPTYYDPTDEAVQQGLVNSGDLKPFEEFYQDDTLQYANHANLPDYDTLKGNYVYFDFWVATPMDYDLRISMEHIGEDSSEKYAGSYAVALPQAVNTVDEMGVTAYELLEASQATASLRMGFQVNQSQDDTALALYEKSADYDSRYTQLRGIYAEPGETYYHDWDFTIYEPNGTVHPTAEEQEALLQATGGLASGAWLTDLAEPGSYVETKPLGVVDGQVTAVGISDRLMVQTANEWADLSLFQTLFTESVAGNTKGLTLDELEEQFYQEHLQGNYGNYVVKGNFVQNTADLYANMENGVVDQSTFDTLAQAGATDDIIITSLQANVPQRIRLYIWVEGQDVDCTNGVVQSKIALSLEFAGSNESIEE